MVEKLLSGTLKIADPPPQVYVVRGGDVHGTWTHGFPLGYVGAGPVWQTCLMFASAIAILIILPPFFYTRSLC